MLLRVFLQSRRCPRVCDRPLLGAQGALASMDCCLRRRCHHRLRGGPVCDPFCCDRCFVLYSRPFIEFDRSTGVRTHWQSGERYSCVLLRVACADGSCLRAVLLPPRRGRTPVGLRRNDGESCRRGSSVPVLHLDDWSILRCERSIRGSTPWLTAN